MIVSIDFETRSEVDITKVGVHRYALDESTQILCMAWMPEGEEPALWLPGQPFPKRLHRFVRDESVIFCAWNAEFEIQIWKRVAARHLRWPEIPVERWHDTMADAAMCSFPLKLEKCAEAIGAEQKKDSRGTRLINKLSKPRKGGGFWSYNEAREDYHELYEYCRQDVRTEADIYHRLPAHVNGKEARIQRLTWLTNERGVPVDVNTVHLLRSKIDQYMLALNARISRHTNGQIETATQRERIRQYVSIDLDNMQGETLEPIMEGELDPSDRLLLDAYVSANHASVAKFKRILLQVCPDDTVKSNIQYHGAGTGRDAARGFQLQNLPRATTKHPDELIEIFNKFDVDFLDMLFPILKTASTLIRPCIAAPPGKKLVVSDFNQIEAVGTAWTAKEEDILANFYAGIDPYKAQAASMYHIEYDQVEGMTRQYGKIAVLACGYQGSHRALTDFAALYGLELERKEAAEIVRRFRTSRPRLVDAWYAFADAAAEAVNKAGQPIRVAGCSPCTFQMQGQHLTMKLPSGRLVWYPYAKMQMVTVKYEDAETGEMKSFKSNAVTCMWVSSYTHRWERRGMSGGNLFQNYVQAICRDLLMDAHIRCEDEGYKIVGRVHDELIALCPDDSRYTVTQMNKLMAVPPEWATNFPIKAEGYESKRYRK